MQKITLNFKPSNASQTEQISIKPLGVVVCENYPVLKQVYDRAVEYGRTEVANRVQALCDRLDQI